MSSTSSSDEARQTVGFSSTETLASRYRHLFVLPSTGLLLVCIAVAVAVFDSIVTRGLPAPATFVASFLLAILAAFVISKSANFIDRSSIATFRRCMAAIFSGQLLWMVCIVVGSAYSFLQPAGRNVGNSVVFGAFLCAGFEVMVINGAFIERAPASVLLGAIHPLAVLLSLALTTGVGFSEYAIVPGATAFFVSASFPSILKRRKTSRGYNAVALFRAFMKTWANDDASELESIISAHAERRQVSSKVLRFGGGDGDTFIVLPGVHPGPFYPVGSYNLPGLLSRSFEGTGHVLALHGPGGHENNLATNADAKQYSDELRVFAKEMRSGSETARMRGPSVTKVGKATASGVAFENDLLLTISFAPYGSDDLETEAELELTKTAAEDGYEAAVVDAHNSIEAKRETLDPHSPEWRLLIRSVKEAPAEEFRVGYARSQEVDFPASGDVTENGISVAVIETKGTDWVLVLADANNAVPRLRGGTAAALESAGYRLLEFCTSDSHDLAARGLTAGRGYHALGEVTPPDSLSAVVVRLAGLARSRLASCSYCSGTLVSDVNVFGEKALNEFAELTRRSSRFAKEYAWLAALSTVVLLASSLVV